MRRLDRRNFCVDKYAYTHASIFELRDKRLNCVHLRTRRKASVRCADADGVRYERRLMRQRGFYNPHQVVMRIAFDVEFAIRILCEQGGQRCDVVQANMSLIGTRMHSDTSGTGIENCFSGMQQIR